MAKKTTMVCVIAAGLLCCGQSEGGGTVGAEFLLSEISAATAALAAGQAYSGGSEAMQRNPAAIMAQQDPSVSFTHFTTFGDTAYEQLEGLYPNLLGGNLAARLFYASTYNFPDINEYGQEVGTVDNHDALLHLAYAQHPVPQLDTGIAFKLFESSLAGFQRTGMAVDFGARWQTPIKALAVGMSLQNAGTMSRFFESDEVLPLQFSTGIGLCFPLSLHHSLTLLSDITTPLAGNEDNVITAGLEYNWQSIAFLRAGYRFVDELGTLSLGAGIQYGGFGVDYAYQPLQDLGENHRFTFYYIVK